MKQKVVIQIPCLNEESTIGKVVKKLKKTKTSKKKISEEPALPKSSPKDIGNFDVYWPKVLQKAKDELTPRKYSYLTLVSPEIGDQNKLILLINKENEYLIERTVHKDWVWANPKYDLILDKQKDAIKTIILDPSGLMADIDKNDNFYVDSKEDSN